MNTIKDLLDSSQNVSNFEIRVSKPQFSSSRAFTAEIQNWSGDFVQNDSTIDVPKAVSTDSPQLSSNLHFDELIDMDEDNDYVQSIEDPTSKFSTPKQLVGTVTAVIGVNW